MYSPHPLNPYPHPVLRYILIPPPPHQVCCDVHHHGDSVWCQRGLPSLVCPKHPVPGQRCWQGLVFLLLVAHRGRLPAALAVPGHTQRLLVRSRSYSIVQTKTKGSKMNKIKCKKTKRNH